MRIESEVKIALGMPVSERRSRSRRPQTEETAAPSSRKAAK